MADSHELDNDTLVISDGRSVSSLKCNELKEELEKFGLPKSGNKKDLVKRLSLALSEKKEQENEKNQSNENGDSHENEDPETKSNPEQPEGVVSEEFTMSGNDQTNQNDETSNQSSPVVETNEDTEEDVHHAVELQANVSDDEDLNSLDPVTLDKPSAEYSSSKNENDKIEAQGDDQDLDEEGEILDESEESDVPVKNQSSRSRKWEIKKAKSDTIKIDSKSLDSLLPSMDRSLKPTIRERLAQMIEEDEEQENAKNKKDDLQDDDSSTKIRRVVSMEEPIVAKEGKKSSCETIEPPSQSSSKPTKKKGPRENKLVGCPVDAPVKDENTKAPPAKRPVSNYVFITNLVRPFTVTLLKEMLVREYGDVVDIWLDRIKSKSVVQFAAREVAEQARNNLSGCRWPSSNPKFLETEYSKKEEFEWMKEHGDTAKSVPDHIWGQSTDERKRREEDREKHRKLDTENEKRRKEKEIDKSRKENDSTARKHSSKERDRRVSPKRDRSPIRRDRSPLTTKRDKSRDREPAPVKKRNPPEPNVREWDLNKKRQSDSPKRDTERVGRRGDVVRDDRSHPNDKRVVREVDRERKQSPSPPKKTKKNSRDASCEPEKKKKKEEPAKLLDDLFYKTKVTPSIYWLPLTEEQMKKKIAENQERSKQRETEKQRLLDVGNKNITTREARRSPGRSTRPTAPPREKKRSRSPPSRRR